MSKAKTIVPFSPKQKKVLCWWCPGLEHARCDAIICDGAVRSGKTFCMSVSFFVWATVNFDSTDFAVCGKTVNGVRRNVISTVLPVLKENGFSVNEVLSRRYITVEALGHKNRFYLFGGKDESSASLIQGMTLGGVMLDEAALMPRSFVEQALARCSLDNAKFWFNCNPEHPGHWFYTEWIKQCESKNCLYLHFTMEDNPSLSEKVKKRYRNLYSGTFYERFVEGRWVAAQGCVYPMFSTQTNVGVPPGGCSRFYVSCDYGTVNPSSFGLWGEYGGRFWRLDEYYYDSRLTGCQRTDEEHYEALERLAGKNKIEAVIVDPSAASFIACIERHGRFRVIKADNSVIDGIRLVSDALRSGKIVISPACRDAIREFGLYRWCPEGGRDSVIKENDHAMDDIRYFVAYVMKFSCSRGFAAVSVSRERSKPY